MTEPISLLDEIREESERDILTNGEAEYALQAIAESRAEIKRVDTLETEAIQRARERAEDLRSSPLARIEYYTHQLHKFLRHQDVKPTKSGLRKLAMINGTLRIKPQAPEIQRDDTALAEWMENNGYADLVETKKVPKWGDFKSREGVDFTESGTVTTASGEVVVGAKAVRREDKFEVIT